jgi:hypothetical protein
VPRNCTVKWDCPGCSTGGLCPPWYSVILEGIDPKAWDIGIYTSGGDYVRSFLRPTDQGVVLSFRPSPRAFKEGEIGDYVLSFESDKVRLNQEFTVKARLEVSNKPPRANP